jgi:hypothetical protein
MDETRPGTSQESMEDRRLRQEALRVEYGEVCNNFRMLTDIRFRLLAFLPIASAAAVVAALVAAMNKNVPPEIGLAVGFALSLFGLVATIGLATYNARNDQLYNELVGRAAAIERSLNLPDGAFANRPGTWQRVALPGIEWKIDHKTAVRTIYGASITLWLFGVVAFVLEGCRRAYVAANLDENFSPEGSAARMILVAVAILIAAAFWSGHQIKKQVQERRKKVQERRKKMECLARDAVEVATKLELEAPEAAERQEFKEEFVLRCTDLAVFAKVSGKAKGSDTKEEIAAVRARAKFYAQLGTERLSYYVPQGSKELRASHLIGLLTDLSPLWIYDCRTNRKGNISVKDCKSAGQSRVRGN